MDSDIAKTILITGGANGIGLGIAKSFSAKGFQVFIADVDRKNGELVALNNNTIQFIQADLSSPGDITKIFKYIINETGHLDILINNVGISYFKPLLELTVDEWDKVINTNLRSAFLCSKEFARYREYGSYGRIINISSTRHLMSEPNGEAYAASKGGLVSLTHALAVSLQGPEFTVNCISPGWIHTGNSEELRHIDHDQHLSKRVGNINDIANLCMYLCQPENDFITGQNFYIDGGMTKKMIYNE